MDPAIRIHDGRRRVCAHPGRPHVMRCIVVDGPRFSGGLKIRMQTPPPGPFDLSPEDVVKSDDRPLIEFVTSVNHLGKAHTENISSMVECDAIAWIRGHLEEITKPNGGDPRL